MRKNILILPLALLLIIITTGCGNTQSIAEKVVEDQLEKALGQDINVDMTDDNVEITAKDGSSMHAGEGTTLPKDFPKDVYILDGELVASMENMGGIPGATISILTNKSISEIKNLYEEKLKLDGWSIAFSSFAGDMLMMSAGKDGRMISISVGPDEESGKTNLVLTVN